MAETSCITCDHAASLHNDHGCHVEGCACDELRLPEVVFDREPGIGPWEGRVGALLHYHLPEGREIVVYPLLYGRGRLVTGDISLDFWERGYDYDSVDEAIEAAKGWIDTEKPPPGNWTREMDGGASGSL